MFDSITISPTGNPPHAKIDVGFLAECLLFYRKVRVVCAAEQFKSLVRGAGAEELLDLCDLGILSIEFLDNLAAVFTVQTNVGECHDFGLIESSVTKFPQVARKVAQEETGSSGRGFNRLYKRLNRAVARSQYTKEIIKGSQDDLTNRDFLEQAVKRVLAVTVPEYQIPSDFYFRPRKVPGIGVQYDTNIDFTRANELFHRTVSPTDASLNPAFLLVNVSTAQPDIIIASHNSSEIAVDELKSAIVASRFAFLLDKASESKNNLELFREVAIGSRSVREVVNGGDKTIRDVIDLLQKAEKFKKWIADRQDDDNLRDEYCREVSAIDWVDKLPPKSLRFIVMASLSALAGIALTPAAGIAAGIGLNAADYYLIDRLLKGWKPNQFVEGPLKKFLGPDMYATQKRRAIRSG
jgi:hypothetical protein